MADQFQMTAAAQPLKDRCFLGGIALACGGLSSGISLMGLCHATSPFAAIILAVLFTVSCGTVGVFASQFWLTTREISS